ncbi:GntR family transcriptional regulator [Leisingera sp. M527]|uniref:GntR family transcriptional regulator n=1 Tax=Leisingera sp. M527 TaxID=2867014 RepID=UPI0021A7EC8A|nr:GntR family transcriptional regulator [Leisingera sp. M527]UWQ33245.1 GntR family transcriptional regulator [Leisingera sp. M527]
MGANDLTSEKKMPAFQKVIDHLRDQIRRGKLPEHSALPSERAIGEQFGISRMTARRALLAVEQEGLAYSSGRRGRFVSPQRLTYDISKTVSFFAHAESGELGLKIELISKQLTQADAALAAKLAVAEGDTLYKYTRLFLLKGHPAFVEEEFAVAHLFPDLFSHDLQQSTTLLMEREYGMPPHSGDISIRMRALNEEEAGLLGLPTYNAGIELEQVIYDAAGRPFCFDRQIWRGELAEFTAHAIVRDRHLPTPGKA